MVPLEEKKPDWLIGLLNVIALSVALAVLFVYVELLLAVQSPYWTGGVLSDWYETAQALGVYLTALAVLALVPFCVIAPFLMASTLRQSLSVLLPFLAALGLWLYAYRAVEAVPSAMRFGVPGALAAILIVVAVLGATRVVQPGVSAVLLIIAILGGIATLYVAAIDHLLDPDRTSSVGMTSLLWVAVSGLGTLVVCLATVRAWPRWAVRTVATLVVCGLYPVFLFLQPYVERLVADGEKQNVLLITVGAMRADYCSVYGGSVPTPNLEALAAEGVLFNRHYALAPWTVPSISGLMTSKYPPGLTPNVSGEQRADEEQSYQQLAGYWMDRDGVTFTKRLGNLGYDTAAIYAEPTIESQEWLTQGFQETKLVNSTAEREPIRFIQTPILRTVAGRFVPELLEDRILDSNDAVRRLGVAFMRRQGDRPFLLWLHFANPSAPYDPPERFRSGETPWTMFPPEAATLDAEAESRLSEDEKRAARSLYESEIRYVDDSVGQLLFDLRNRGLQDETLVCFTSAHGEEFWEHRRWGHGYDLFDEQTRVPLIIAGPQVMPNEIEVPVSAVDVLPTIAAALGVDAKPDWRGTSLMPALTSGSADELRRPVFAQATNNPRYNPEPTQMVVDRNLKLIIGLESGIRRLYDSSDDPGEETNLADSMPEEVERLLGILEVWSASFPSDFEEALGWCGGEAGVPASTNFNEALESLGYVR